MECNRELFFCYVPPPLCRCAGTEFRRLGCLMTRCRCSHYRERKVREEKPANTEQMVMMMMAGFCGYMSVCLYVRLCVYLFICRSN